MPQRSTFLASTACGIVSSVLPAAGCAAQEAALAQLEKRSGGRLGVFARDLANGRTVTYHGDERFPMCSTFKVLLVSAVLQRVDRHREHLERRIAYTKADLQAYAPVSAAHVAQGTLTIAELCEAAIVMSDNTAANLLLRSVGGPAAVTAFMRAHPFDDPMTRLDRNEPSLNTAITGDARDTTTPARMVNALALLLTTTAALKAASTRMLEKWMRDCKTGASTLRAGAPAHWTAGDKTGSGANGTRNDVAIFRPPQRAPVIVAAYLTGAMGIGADARSAILAHVARVVSVAFA